MMFGQRLVCRVVPVSQQHPQLFKGANKKFRVVPRQAIEAERHNRVRTPEEEVKRIKRLVKVDNRRKRRIEGQGIDYAYEGLSAKRQRSKPKRTTFDEDSD